MQSIVSPHLLSTYRLINCTFPDGIESEAYFPLLALLYDEISARNLAEIVAHCTGKNYGVVLNDLYRVRSTDIPEPEAIEKVRQRLLPCGYEKWLEQG